MTPAAEGRQAVAPPKKKTSPSPKSPKKFDLCGPPSPRGLTKRRHNTYCCAGRALLSQSGGGVNRFRVTHFRLESRGPAPRTRTTAVRRPAYHHRCRARAPCERPPYGRTYTYGPRECRFRVLGSGLAGGGRGKRDGSARTHTAQAEEVKNEDKEHPKTRMEIWTGHKKGRARCRSAPPSPALREPKHWK